MKSTLRSIAIGSLLLISSWIKGQDIATLDIGNEDIDVDQLLDMSLEHLLNIDVNKQEPFRLYGFFDSNFEKVWQEPAIGTSKRTDGAPEWTPVKNFHLYASGDLSQRISFLFNLAVPGGTSFEVRNAWANYLFHDLFQVRLGKIYRRFGLYNERWISCRASSALSLLRCLIQTTYSLAGRQLR